VLKEEQGKGIGSQLLEEAETMTRNHSKNKLYLYVHQKNKQAINFYFKHDFNFSGIFLDKYGEGEHALLMCKNLS
jgi:ribosomal protein S18 acetylase RimI-like enzyme